MDVKQLKYFVEICKYRSFSKAAENLYISQQGLSMAMQRLESELSYKLFHRTGRELVLTRQAEFLLPYAQSIIEQFETCENYFRDSRQKADTVCVACAQGSIEEFAGSLIFEFQREHPQIKLTVVNDTDLNCEDRIDREEADLGFSILPLNEKKLEWKLLFTSPVSALVHESHPFARQESLSIAQLEGVPLIVMNEDSKTHETLLEACRKAGFQPEIFLKAREILLIHRLVNAGKGVGLTVDSVARDIPMPHTRLIPIRDADLTWSACFIKKKDAVLSPAARTFERFVLRRMEEREDNPLVDWQGDLAFAE